MQALRDILKRLFPSFAGALGEGGSAGSGKVPTINLIPDAFKPKPFLNKERAMMGLVVLELFIVFIAFRQYGTAATDTIANLAGREDPQTTSEQQINILNNQINGIQGKLNRINSASKSMTNQDYDWPQLLDHVFSQTVEGITVSVIRENSGEAVLSGSAKDPSQVIAYNNFLFTSPIITNVKVQAIGTQSTSGSGIGFTFILSLKGGITK